MKFKVSQTIIDHLRSFKLNQNDFQDEFLFKLDEMLSEYLLCNSSFPVQPFPPKKLALALHFYFGSIYSLDELLKKSESKGSISKLSSSDGNKTNILSIQILFEAIENIANKVNPNFVKQNLDFLNLSFSFDINESQVVQISKDLIEFGIKSKGKIDLYIVSSICQSLNEQLNLTTFPTFFIKSKVSSQIFVQRYALMANNMLGRQNDGNFNKEKYLYYRKKIVSFMNILEKFNGKINERVDELLSEIECYLENLLVFYKSENSKYIEKLLIGMLGHPMEKIRNSAIVYLNCLYDGVDWQLRGPFNPKIACVGETFKIEYLIETEDEQNLIMQVNSPSFSKYSSKQVLSWHFPEVKKYTSPSIKSHQSSNKSHQPNQKEQRFFIVSLDLGSFQKCGFYDWKLFQIQKSGKLKGQPKIYSLKSTQSFSNFTDLQELNLNYKDKLIRPVQGRFIVSPKNTRNSQFHELYPELIDEMIHHKADASEAIKSSYETLEYSLKIFKQMNINLLYCLGLFERDQLKDSTTNNSKSSPLSITNRQAINKTLGSNESFKSFIAKANENDIKIICDCVTRVSSSKPQRKYWNLFLNCLDQEGKKLLMYGAEGKAVNSEDTIILNYRKQKSWNLLIKEYIFFISKYKIHGLHLDGCQDWPQIFKIHEQELFRKEKNENEQQNLIYTEKEIFYGEIVHPNEISGFWDSSFKNNYANPFLMKLCKKIWKKFPDFYIIGEVQTGKENECKEAIISRSGPIPRIYHFPLALQSIIKKQSNQKRVDVLMLKGLYENIQNVVPRNCILINSTTSHIWPYPSDMYLQGTKAAIDFYFFLPEIPGTFLGEQFSHNQRPNILNIFKKINQKVPDKKMSYFNESKNEISSEKSENLILENDQGSYQNQLRTIPSGVTFCVFYLEKQSNSIDTKNGTESDGDILEHYLNRRDMREQNDVLKQGKFISLFADSGNEINKNILTFGRYKKNEIFIISINFSNQLVKVFRSIEFIQMQKIYNIYLKIMKNQTLLQKQRI